MAIVNGWGRGTWGEGAWNEPDVVEPTGVAGTGAVTTVTVDAEANTSVTGVSGTSAVGISHSFGSSQCVSYGDICNRVYWLGYSYGNI